MTESDIRGNSRGIARGFAGVTIAGLLGNVFAYLLLLLAARTLNPPDYSVLITLLNLLLVGSIPSFALQAVAARRVATATGHALRDAGLAVGLTAAVIMTAASPTISAFLHLDGVIGPILVALALPGIALQGLSQGIWQGRENFGALAVTTFIGIAGRFGPAVIVILVGGSSIPALLAIVTGVTIAALASAWPLSELRGHAHRGVGQLVPSMVESIHASHGYGAFLLLSVSDLLLARHVLPAASAAVYAAGSVLTKAALWVPQSVASVLFASLTDQARHRSVFLRAVGGLALLGAALTAGSALLGGLVAIVVGGNRYPQLGHQIWLFAALGSCLAIIQFTLVAGLAMRRTRVVALIWACIIAEAVAVLTQHDHARVGSVVGSVLVVNILGILGAVLLTARAGREPRNSREGDPIP